MPTQFWNIHKNARAFIVASGPSVLDQDLSWLKEEIVISVNQSHLALEKFGIVPKYACCGDRELWARGIGDVYAQMPDSTIIFSSGLNDQVGRGYDAPNRGMVMPLCRVMDMRDSIRHGTFNPLDPRPYPVTYKAFGVVGETAIPFCLHAGFREIYLLGCDCNDAGHCYSSEDSLRADAPPTDWALQFREYAALRQYAEQHTTTRIFNATRGGALEKFPRVDFDRLNPHDPQTASDRPLMVVGYWTGHERYRELAEGMADSVREHGYMCSVFHLPAAAKPEYEGRPNINWVLNCSLCAEAIIGAMKRYPNHDILYLDADARMQRRFDWIEKPRAFDFAAPYLTNRHCLGELQSNVLYFAATPAGRQLAERWATLQWRRNNALVSGEYEMPYHEAWDQKVLEDVLSQHSVPGLRAIQFPAGTNYISDTSTGYRIMPDNHPDADECVFVQWQASREMRMKL